MASTNSSGESLHDSPKSVPAYKEQALDVAHELETLKQFSTSELKKVWDHHEFQSDLDLTHFRKFLSTILELPAESSILPRLFTLADLDKDGAVSFQEITTLFTILSIGEEQEKLSLLFDLFDLNGDGFVTQLEFAEVVETF